MYYDFECIIKNKKHIPIACGIYIYIYIKRLS